MEIVTANRAIERIKNGCTKPYHVLCDGESYIVKFQQNPEGPRVLVNEYVCSKLAQLLKLPVPSPALVQVTSEFMSDYGREISEHIEADLGIGIHFGTKKIKKVFPLVSTEMLRSAKNADVIPEILLFDHWIGNFDRARNGGNLLFDASKMEIVMIDHTHAFELGSLWSATQLNIKINEGFTIFDTSGYVYKKFVPFIRGNHPFHSILEKMSRLTRDDLWNIISSIPDEWNVPEEDRVVLHSYLWKRLCNIEKVLLLLKPVLPYWKGGA